MAYMAAGHLPLDTRKERYGVTYLRAVVAQAGYGFTEGAPGEDHLGVDCDIVPSSGINVHVQVKCTTIKEFTLTDPHLSWSVKPSWRTAWAKSDVPIYFVAVHVSEANLADWISHATVDSTLHNAAAYWTVIEPSDVPATLKVPRSQRVTCASIDGWVRDLRIALVGAAGV